MHGSQMSHSANRSMMPAEKGGSIKVTLQKLEVIRWLS